MGKYAPRQGAGRLAHPWFIHCPGLPLKRISESWVYVYHNPGLYSRMLQKAFPEPSILPPFWSLAEQPIKDSSLFGQSYLRKSEFQILKGGSHDEQKQSQERGPLIKETAWQLRGVAEIPKGKKKKNERLGCWKASLFHLCLNWISFTVIKFSPEALDRCKIQGLSSPAEWKQLSKWWTSFFTKLLVSLSRTGGLSGSIPAPPSPPTTWLIHD